MVIVAHARVLVLTSAQSDLMTLPIVILMRKTRPSFVATTVEAHILTIARVPVLAMPLSRSRTQPAITEDIQHQAILLLIQFPYPPELPPAATIDILPLTTPTGPTIRVPQCSQIMERPILSLRCRWLLVHPISTVQCPLPSHTPVHTLVTPLPHPTSTLSMQEQR